MTFICPLVAVLSPFQLSKIQNCWLWIFSSILFDWDSASFSNIVRCSAHKAALLTFLLLYFLWTEFSWVAVGQPLPWHTSVIHSTRLTNWLKHLWFWKPWMSQVGDQVYCELSLVLTSVCDLNSLWLLGKSFLGCIKSSFHQQTNIIA